MTGDGFGSGVAGVDLNIDLGELVGEPLELYELATVVNIACGGHAGDAASMRRACAWARRGGARVAAHPSYPDREGFGRASMEIEPDALRQSVAAQCRSLADAANAAGFAVRTVKPHGALYHDAARSPEVAEAVLAGARAALGDALEEWVAMPNPALAAVAAKCGVRLAAEGFADRAYRADGSLVPRREPGAVLGDPAVAAAQAVRLARTGAFVTICVHGDHPKALDVARAVRRSLEQEGLCRAREASSATSG